MCVAWLDELKRGPSVVVPTKGAPDDPSPTPGRSDHHLVLPDRRPLPNPQPARISTRPSRGSRTRRSSPWRSSSNCGGGIRTLLLARGRPLLLPALPWGRRPPSLLVPPLRAQAQAIPRTPEARRRARVGGRSLKTLIVDSTLLEVLHPRLVPKVGGVRWSFLGEVGHLQRLWDQAAPALRHEPCSHLLRAHPGQRRGCSPDQRALGGGAVGGGGSEEALLADLAYRIKEVLDEELTELGIVLVSSEATSKRPGVRQQVEIAFSSLKRVLVSAKRWRGPLLDWRAG